ncbi:MAG: hypothetical protein IH965_13665 [Gemmatimonadetes bacterium]|nr:hypothetical protein [Gemmatimonadota bacterium]
MEITLENGRIVDLLARKDGFTAGIEIETEKSDAVDNIKSLIAGALDKIISVPLSKPEAECLTGFGAWLRTSPHDGGDTSTKRSHHP